MQTSPIDTMSEPAAKRPIRSFVRREGRLTAGQERALNDLWPLYGIETAGRREPLDYSLLFGNRNPVILEIGFGNGELLAAIARQHPDRNFLGIEVHRPGVGHLMLKLQEDSIENVRIISQDAVEILRDLAPDSGLEGIWLFFPDPWPKKKHRKRRIVSANFLDLAARALTPSGYLHLATDWQDYAEQMEMVLEKDNRFIRISTRDTNPSLVAQRPRTKFEQRGERKGHLTSDLIYRVATP